MYCPKCGEEFREGYTRCAECGCDLVERLPRQTPPDPRPYEKEALLCMAADEFEANLMIAKLKAEGIYAFPKYQGSDSYNKILLGRTILGVGVYVAESDFDTAYRIIHE